ncbi:hypothetical protein PG984_005095 [Apiospora sp. TS-2023a]
MQSPTLALTVAIAATSVLAAGAPPITITTTVPSSSSTASSLYYFQTSPTSRSETASSAPKPLGTGTPSGGGGSPQQAAGRPQVHVVVESPATDDACGKGTNTTILVPIDGVYANRTVLGGKIAALYVTDVTGGHPQPPLSDITCLPYLKENGTGTPADSAFTFDTPLHLASTVGTPNHIGSIFCTIPIPAGAFPAWVAANRRVVKERQAHRGQQDLADPATEVDPVMLLLS